MDKTNLSILLIEDDSGYARLLREVLAHLTVFQIELTQAETLNQGLQYLAENQVDLVLSDLTLPDSWGLEVLARLSQHVLSIPIIALIDLDKETLAVEVLQAGAQDYLLKEQVSGDVLARAIRYAIKQQQLRWDLQTKMNSLLRSESRLQAMIEHNADGIVIVDKAGLIRFVNLAAEQIFGRKADALLGAPFGFPLVIGEKTELDILRNPSERVVAEMRVGETDWEGQAAFLASLRDVTERKRIEEQFRLVVEASPYAIILVGEKGLMHLVNSQAEVLFGYSRQEMLGQSVELLVPDVFHTVHIRERESFMSTPVARPMGRGRNLFGRHKGGKLIPVEIGLSSVTTPEGVFVLASVVDITERKRAEAEIMRRNRELALLNQVIAASAANQAPEVILEIACRELALTFDLPQATALLFNEERTTITVVAEYRLESQPAALGAAVPVTVNSSFYQLLQFNVPLVLTGVQSDARLAPLHKLLGRNGVTSLLLLPLRVQGQVIGNLSLEATAQRYFAPEEVNLAWSVADQVGGALAHARLNQLHQRLSTVVEQAAESVMITDTDGVIVYVNPAFEHISGYTQAEVVGQTPRLLKGGQQSFELYQELWAMISAGEVWRGRFINKNRDGELYIEDATISPVRNESGTIVNYVSVQRDVSRELQLEEQYRQAQKMEAVGRLAGGVAHDFNNMLVIINGYCEILLRRHLNNNDTIRKFVEEIHQAGERAAGLTRQLLAFSRKQLLQPEIIDLNEIIIELEKMLLRLIGEDIELITQLRPGLGQIKADPGQIEQIVMNLVINARDAMPNGGILIIETANVELDETYTRQHADVTPGPHVMLAVSDNGVGMDAATQAHIFEPFFTTKGMGQGTGLGLATVFGIVKQSGGDIWVYSEPGQGTAFKIYLPRVDEPVPALEIQPAPAELPGGPETILLVEDETSVRVLARRILEMNGYTVLDAKNGSEALQLCAQETGPIHMLVTDVVMPGGLNGRELAERLQLLRPGLKTLYISGYTDDAIVHHGVLGSEMHFMQKPFSPRALAQKVRQILDLS